MNEIADLISQKNDPEQVFQILDVLGQGSYGSVSKALHKETGELYAIKILPATSGVEIASIKKQVGILKQCDDDHIVRYYGSYFKDNNLWIVMEYCIAGSVTDIIQITKKKLNQNEIASIIQSSLKGLKYLHQRKKIHRDIKAANILLDQKGNAKLADFGVSASAMNTNARFRTHIGSPYWMSPQIIKYSEYDYKTDIWSLGITAIELAEGQVPNSHVKPFMAIFQIKSNPVQSLKDPSLWSPEFNDFVKQCLQVNPINRPDARELLDHAFIKKYSKGQRLLAELVLSSMQQIQQFRMTQSRNISFAEIIVDDGRQCEETKTLVENSQSGTVKEVGTSQFQKSIEGGLQGSMVILDSNRSQSNSCADLVTQNENTVDNKGPSKNTNQNALANYINGMKQMYNVELKCAQMLTKTINSYDQQLIERINKVYEQFKSKVVADIKSLKQLKQKNPSLKFDEQYHCKIIESHDIIQFLLPSPKQTSQKQQDNTSKQFLQIDSKHDLQDQVTINLRQQKTVPQLIHKAYSNQTKNSYQSVQDRKSVQVCRKYQDNAPIKSFIDPQNCHNISQFNNGKKQIYYAPKQYLNEVVCHQIRFGQSQGDILKTTNQNRNSSRIMMRIVDQFAAIDSEKMQKHEQLKIMTKDPDIVDYLKSKEEFKISQSAIEHVSHTKSQFYPTYTCSKTTTEGIMKHQGSTEQSMSKSKNKSVKNLKAKKKSRVAC